MGPVVINDSQLVLLVIKPAKSLADYCDQSTAQNEHFNELFYVLVLRAHEGPTLRS